MLQELELLKAIYAAVYNTFAHRLSLYEWEEAEAEFQNNLAMQIDNIKKDIHDTNYPFSGNTIPNV